MIEMRKQNLVDSKTNSLASPSPRLALNNLSNFGNQNT